MFEMSILSFTAARENVWKLKNLIRVGQRWH